MKVTTLPIILFIILKSSISGASVDGNIDVKLPWFPIFSYILLKSSKSGSEVHPSPLYPMYWEVDGDRKLLLGGFDYGSPFLLTGSALTTPLNALQTAGGNYLRNTMADYTTAAEDRLYPFHERSDGLYDLSQWNDTYWTQLDNLFSQCDSRDIVVSVELWDPWNLCDGENTWWADSPWAPVNNINYTTTTSGLSNTNTALPYNAVNPFYKSVPALDNKTALLQYQQAFVRKMLKTAASYDNVLFQIDNESFAPLAWTDYWSQFIQDNKHGDYAYVCDMRNDWDIDSSDVRNVISNTSIHQFLDVSQVSPEASEGLDANYNAMLVHRTRIANSGVARPVNRVKVYAWEYDSGWSPADEDLAIDRFVSTIFAGAAGVRFHKGTTAGIGLSAAAKQAITGVRYLDNHADIDFAKMVPIQVPTGYVGSVQTLGWKWRSVNEVYGMLNDVDHVAIFCWTSVGNKIETNFNLSHWGAGTVSISWYNMDAGGSEVSGGTKTISTGVAINHPSNTSYTRWCAIVKKL